MNTNAYFPTRLHWTSEQLADAVPRRLHSLFPFAADDAGIARDAANHEARRARKTLSYTQQPRMPARFQVR